MAFSDEQRRNAAIIAQVGQQMGMSQRDILIGIMTAMQESGLRNLNYGDRDSLGLFQQRPSQGWGSRSQVTDPQYAAGKFFSALKGVKGRDGMALTKAAQAVQRSAFPDAYAKHESGARDLLASLGVGGGGDVGVLGDPFGGFYGDQGTVTQRADRNILAGLQDQEKPEALQGVQGIESPMPFGLEAANTGLGVEAAQPGLGVEQAKPGSNVAANMRSAAPSFEEYMGIASGGAQGQVAEILAKAQEFLGTPYKWGGSTALGLDCSGFTSLVFSQFGIDLPHLSYLQAQMGKATSEPAPGDLFFEDWSSRNDGKGGGGADHVGIYMGNGKVIEANRRTGEVSIGKVRGGMWFRRILG